MQVFSLPALSSCFKLGANTTSEGAALSMLQHSYSSPWQHLKMCVGVAPACEMFITSQTNKKDLPAFTQTLKVTLNHYSPFTHPHNNMLAEAMTEEALPLCV